MLGGNGNGNGERREGYQTIAVAVERNKANCQSALKFAIDHLVYSSDHIVKLVHVIQRFPSSNPSPSGDNTPIASQADHSPVLDILLPFRGYCMRKNVKHEVAILEDQDVARALIEYISRNRVESFLLGRSSSKTGLARLFKTNEIPSSVLKWAPDFCSVYTIYKGRVCGMRAASRPVPAIPEAERAPSKAESHTAYDEVSVTEHDFSFVSQGRPSTDSMPYSFYDYCGAKRYSADLDSSIDLNTLQEQKVLVEDTGDDEMKTLRMELKQTIEMYHAICKEAVLTKEQKKDMEDEIKGLRMELTQTVKMYHAASKEAVAAKQKAIELQEWTMKEELRLKDTQQALEATVAVMEEEKAKSKAAILAAEAAQRFAEAEVQKRVHAEQLFKALKEAYEEKNKVLDALRQAQLMTRYQSLLHIFVVLFLFYFYLSIF